MSWTWTYWLTVAAIFAFAIWRERRSDRKFIERWREARREQEETP